MSQAYKDIQSALQGSMVALVTPMTANAQAIDYDRFADLVDWHIEQGTHALVVAGTTGESATLSMQEHCDVIRFVVQHTKARVPVIAGTGANSTAEAIELTTAAKAAGADCALLVAPYYNKPPQEGLYQHYKAIACAVDMPQMLYNVPGRTVVDMQPETVARLAELPNVVAIKDATSDVKRGKALIELVGDRLVVLSGDDGTAIELMTHGAKGNISVTANVAPKAMSQVFSYALQADHAKAKQSHSAIEPLHQALFVQSSPIPVKYALHRMGMIEAGIRLPLIWLEQPYHQDLDSALLAAGIELPVAGFSA